MNTTISPAEVLKSLPQELHQVLLAISVLSTQFAKLNKDDRSDMIELIGCLAQSSDPEERQEIHTAMIEILAGKETATVPLPLDATPVLSKWAEHVGVKIRTLRTTAGMTQQQLAEKAGLQQSHISRIESAEYSPTHMTLSKIAKALDVDVGTIDPCVPE